MVGERDGRLVHLERTPARPGHHGRWPDWADPDLVAAYQRLGVSQPWTHQCQAAESLHAGHHTVIATGTGSGKSLAAWLPALSDVLAAQRPEAGKESRISSYGHRPSVLYLSPTKALSADQAAALTRLVTELEAVQRTSPSSSGDDGAAEPASGASREPPSSAPSAAGPAAPTASGARAPLRTVRVGTCDGDTPLPERDWARAHADVVLTNPDFLHFSLLPGHERWTRFLRSLRYVVVDECHAYRGLLGAHVALVLRRLLRLVRRLQPEGTGPVVLCASATAAEPALTAARLIGVDPESVTAVTKDDAPAGERTLALWQPALRDPWTAWEASVSALAQAADVPAADPPLNQPSPGQPQSLQAPHAAAAAGPDTGDPTDYPSARRSAVVEAAELLTDLMSVGARALVFVRSRRSAEVVAEHARHTLSLSLPELVGSVRAYRGGYLPEERRELENDLRRGRLRALATTNALELGIDVTGLDAVIIAGWPGTRVSLGQQAGRAGRAGSRGLAVLIASDNPLDAYLVHHPEEVFAGPEATVFDPANPYVLAPHLCAAASESPLREDDLALFGLSDDTFLADLAARGALRRRPSGWFWNTSLPGRAQDLTSLRGDGPPDTPVVDAATGTVVGTVPGASADSTVHEGAVYIHQGRTYVVEELSDEAALVTQKAAVGYRTRAKEASSVRIIAERERQDWKDGITWCFGSVEVTSQVVGYTKHALPGMEVVSQHALSMPEHVLPTAAVWWTVPVDLTEHAGLTSADLPGALHAAEHASIGMLPLLATCDRWDIGGLSIALHPQTMTPTVFVHDGHAGGAGFAERGYRAGRHWLEATLEVIEQCGCTSGCPSCVQSPKCGNNNEPLDKTGAVTLLRLLLAAAPAG
ncbi:DEAD/DEAH box helicase [Actinomyces faecalis]|uniref:DEAD/DEAH box helicase n=1 Tax=Actinomyces faecalis TaxID=2722820 RepID=UPI0015516DD3|nr:DEAD/DEAH box helicase [Actinomyces faecalis]